MPKGSKKGFLGGSKLKQNGGDYSTPPTNPTFSGEDGKGGHPSTAKAPTSCEEIRR